MVNSVNILKVDLNKIRKNIKILKDRSGQNFYAVVKANAYGLGSIEVSKEIEDIVYGFCVATLSEAIELRNAGIKKDIIVLGYIDPLYYEMLIKYDIITTIYDIDIARELNKANGLIRAHIKIETGHNRLGFNPCEESFDEIREINNLENIKIEGIFSHLATADEKKQDYTLLQHQRFDYAVNSLSDINEYWIKHLSNDAGIIAYDFKYDAVRSGISMYGVYPSEYMYKKYNIGLECSFEFKSKISFIKEIKKEETVSYGRTYKASRDTKIATIAIGYADGYHRLLSNKGYVLINGNKANIVGNITMDQMMVDVTGLDVKLHDEVILIGKSGNEEITPDMVGNWANTISYEVMTSISPRVSRIYIKEE